MSKRPSPSKHQSKLSPKRVRLEEDPKIIELQQKMKSRIPDIPVVQSENDHRQYRIFTLFNGLKVCLISDPEIDQAAVALTVKFGYMQNHEDGFAHLYQHVLYITRPNNEFSKYVKDNSGIIDSQTLAHTTMYYFDIKATALKRALKQFAKLFEELPEELTEKYLEELTEKIRTESEEAQQNVNYRLSRLFKYNLNATEATKSKYSIKYFKYENMMKYVTVLFPMEYGADIMSLCIIGKESLNDLHVMASRFCSLPNRHLPYNYNLRIEPSSELIQKIWCRDIATETSRLYIIYCLDGLDLDVESGVERYLSYLLTYKGKGTLTSVLKSKGWITSIEVKSFFYNFLNIGMNLTEEGFEHIDDIIALFYQYHNLLRKGFAERWMYNEFIEIQQLKFRFDIMKKPNKKYVQDISRKMLFYEDENMKNILRGNYVPLNRNKGFMESRISSLFEPFPRNLKIFIIERLGEIWMNNAEKLKEKEYNQCVEPECLIRYKVETVPMKLCTEWVNARPELALPASNEFIPTVASLKPLSKADIKILPKEYFNPFENIAIIHDSKFVKLLYKRFGELQIPKTITIMHFVFPYIVEGSSTVLNHHFNLMFIRLLQDYFSHYVYAAALVDLKWKIDNTRYGIQIEISGFDNKQHAIIEKIVDRIVNFKIDVETFEAVKQQNTKYSIDQLKKLEEDQPHHQARDYLTYMLTDVLTTKEVYEEHTRVTYEAFDNYIQYNFCQIFVECLVIGNMTDQEAFMIGHLIDAKLESKRTDEVFMRLNERVIRMEKDQHFVFQAYNKHHHSSSTQVFYQIPERSLRADFMTELIRNIIELRIVDWMKEESLGDYIHCEILKTRTMQGLTILIHGSDDHVHLIINNKIDHFMATIANYIRDLSPTEFDRNKNNLMKLKFPKLQTMPKEKEFEYLKRASKAIWCDLLKRKDFYETEYIVIKEPIQYLINLKLEDVLDFYQKFINKNTPKLSVHITSIHNKKNEQFPHQSMNNIIFIDNIKQFQNVCSAKNPPVIDIRPQCYLTRMHPNMSRKSS